MDIYKIRYYVAWTLYVLFFSIGHAAIQDDKFYWVCAACDQKCPASWSIDERVPAGFSWNTLQIDVQKQRFDLKKKIMRGESIEIFGKSIWIRSPRTMFDYHPHSMRWSLSGPVLVHMPGVYLEADSAIFDQNDERFLGNELKFFLPKYALYGTATSCLLENKKLQIDDLTATQCDIIDPSWYMHIQKLEYDMDEDLLQLSDVGVFLWDYEIFYASEFVYQGLRSKRALESIPRIQIETQSGPALVWPILWTNEAEELEIIPQINFKNGISLGANVVKNNIHAKVFMQTIPFGNNPQESWMISVSSQQNDLESFNYGYQGSLVSDPNFCYRYPGAISFWQQLYLVNQGWIEKQTPLGLLRVSTEKLYRSEQAHQANYEVIEYLGRADWTSNDRLTRLNVGADLIHRYNDDCYVRTRLEGNTYVLDDFYLKHRLSAYPIEEQFVGSLWWKVPLIEIHGGAGNLKIIAAGSLSEQTSTDPILLDVIAQPISYDFFVSPGWHQGLDWGSNGAWITPIWKMSLDENITSEVSCAMAIKSPSNPWSAAGQPYLTPFRDKHFLSPISIRVSGGSWDVATLYDTATNEWVRAEMMHNMYYSTKHIRSGIFYHKYYPLDRLSQQVQSVAQYYCLYENLPENPSKMRIEMTWDLIPIQIAQAKVSFGYEDCCWSWKVSGGVDKEYDPETNGSQWHYKFGFSIDFQALGMLKSKDSKWTGPLENSLAPYQEQVLQKILRNR